MNDQSFKPGDKVMRVDSICRDPGPRHPCGAPQFGKVYCVKSCWLGGNGYNLVSIVGFDEQFTQSGRRMGWVAESFRKVQEIKLCLTAVRQCKEPTQTEPTT